MHERNRLLYQDEKISIYRSKIEPNGHDLSVESFNCLLPRGTLDDLYAQDATRLSVILQESYSSLFQVLEFNKISVQEFGWALAKAKVKSLEEEFYSNID